MDSVIGIKSRLHWKNRKSFTLTIPPGFLEQVFAYFPRTNQACIIRPLSPVNGKPQLVVEFQ